MHAPVTAFRNAIHSMVPERGKGSTMTRYHDLRPVLANWKGGLVAVGLFLVCWAVVFFIAFMTALGNDTPFARCVLAGVEVFALIANPLWGIPCAYIAGAYVVGRPVHQDMQG